MRTTSGFGHRQQQQLAQQLLSGIRGQQQQQQNPVKENVPAELQGPEEQGGVRDEACCLQGLVPIVIRPGRERRPDLVLDLGEAWLLHTVRIERLPEVLDCAVKPAARHANMVRDPSNK